MKKNFKLPKNFKGYFWDCDFNALDPKIYNKFILGRLLHYGGIKAMSWVKKHFEKNEIESYLKTRGKKELDRRSYDFWSQFINIKEIW